MSIKTPEVPQYYSLKERVYVDQYMWVIGYQFAAYRGSFSAFEIAVTRFIFQDSGKYPVRSTPLNSLVIATKALFSNFVMAAVDSRDLPFSQPAHRLSHFRWAHYIVNSRQWRRWG
ncbi:hypothetical protein EVAR_90123_1 [Eumeta japonica]|uniref:Uncharacterized protein n=1 Tax=Eumeta variegata TaxID=151549 RepID=A0A4C2A3S1_EUMVA|nr:hypothetical protein EVAR_90123_1 [Eumeta japonica]